MKGCFAVLLFVMAITWSEVPASTVQNGATSDEHFRIEAFPDAILEGETGESEVKCDFFGPSPLISMSIVKKDNSSENDVTLARVDLNQPKYVDVQKEIHAKQVSGEIKADGRSGYLSIKWPSPTQQQRGLYDCQVVALVDSGRLAQLVKSVRVRAKKITGDALLRIVGSLKEKLGSLKEELASVKGKCQPVYGVIGSLKAEVGYLKGEGQSMKGKIASLKGEVASLKGEGYSIKREIESLKGKVVYLKGEGQSVRGEIASLKGKLGECPKGEEIESLKTEIGHLKAELGSVKVDVHTLKTVSNRTTYKGHSYYLKQNNAMTTSNAQSFCVRMGGYLAEINDRAEYEYVRLLLAPLSAKDTITLVGGIRPGRNKAWVFPRTSSPVTFLTWRPGRSGDNRETPLSLSLCRVNNAGLKMCTTSHNSLFWFKTQRQIGFLCEIPH